MLNDEDAMLFAIYKSAVARMNSASRREDELRSSLEKAEREATESVRAVRSLLDYMRSSGRQALISHIEELEEVYDD